VLRQILWVLPLATLAAVVVALSIGVAWLGVSGEWAVGEAVATIAFLTGVVATLVETARRHRPGAAERHRRDRIARSRGGVRDLNVLGAAMPADRHAWHELGVDAARRRSRRRAAMAPAIGVVTAAAFAWLAGDLDPAGWLAWLPWVFGGLGTLIGVGAAVSGARDLVSGHPVLVVGRVVEEIAPFGEWWGDDGPVSRAISWALKWAEHGLREVGFEVEAGCDIAPGGMLAPSAARMRPHVNFAPGLRVAPARGTRVIVQVHPRVLRGLMPHQRVAFLCAPEGTVLYRLREIPSRRDERSQGRARDVPAEPGRDGAIGAAVDAQTTAATSAT
jgi:hypothetical protein